MICPNCFTENKPGAKFCNECGQRLSEEQQVLIQDEVEAVSSEEAVEAVSSESPFETSLSDEVGTMLVVEPAEENTSSDQAQSNQSTAQLPADVIAVEVAKNAGEAASAQEKAAQGDVLSGLDVATAPAFEVTRFDLDEVDMQQATQQIPLVNESLVGNDYHAPESAWQSGGTMEMEKVDAPASAATSFRAPDPQEMKRRRKEANAIRKQQKQAERALKEQGGSSPVRSKGPIVAVLIVVVAALIAGSTYYLELWGGKTIPNCAGMTEVDARYTLENAGFQVKVDYVSSDDTEGLVLLTDPSSGQRVEKNSVVQIHVATSRIIPTVIGKTEAEAKAALTQAGYTNFNTTEYVKSDDYDDAVLSITPEEGAKAKSTAKITLSVAQAYTVPDVVNSASADAVQAIRDAGYEPVIKYVESATVPEGAVVSTSPAAGEKVRSGTAVTVNVSQTKASRLEKAATSYLSGLDVITIDYTNYEVASIDSVKYSGENRVDFSMTARPFATILGQRVYLDQQTIRGALMFDDNDNVISVIKA